MSAPSPPYYGPASILDIVSFGYKNTFRSLLPMTKLALPFLIFAGLTTGLVYPDILRYQLEAQEGAGAPDVRLFMAYGVLLLGALVMYYVIYVILHYARDVYRGQVNDNFYSYLFPKGDLLGLLGIGILQFIIAIVSIPFMLIGFLLLIVPGLCLIVLMGTWFHMIYVTYINDPSKGVFGAFGANWNLIEGNILRTLGLGCVIWLVQVMISMPFSFINFILEFMAGLNPSFIDSPLFGIAFAIMFMLSYWAQNVLGMGGVIFTCYRYLYDLMARKNPGAGGGGMPEPYGFQFFTE